MEKTNILALDQSYNFFYMIWSEAPVAHYSYFSNINWKKSIVSQ